ncbi:MAG: class D sortase [Lachnospiraceae bacterium]|nr:class D sortase [Lachnospiraceae bacterium]
MKIQHKHIYYVVVPIVFTLLFGIMFFFGLRGALKAFTENFIAGWVQGNPSFDFYQSGLVEDGVNKTDKNPKGSEIVRPVEGDMYGQIYCEKAGINAPLYSGDDKNILSIGVGTYVGENFPGQGKVILTSAHDTTYYAGLKDLKNGDIVSVKTVYGEYSYEVYDSKIINIKESVDYKSNVSGEVLIMYTCYPFGKINTQRDERYFVYAKLTEKGENDGK